MIIQLNKRTDYRHLTLEKSTQSCLDLHNLVRKINFFIINNNFWSVILKENALVFSMHAASLLRIIFRTFNLTNELAGIFKNTK